MIEQLIRRFGEPLRYLVVGGVNTAFNYGLFALLLWLLKPVISQLAPAQVSVLHLAGTHAYAVIQWIAWVLSVPVSTYTMKRFVFRRGGSYPAQVLRAYGVYLPAQLVASGVLIFCVQALGLPELLGQLVAACFSTVISYLGHKFFTFKTPAEEDPVLPG